MRIENYFFASAANIPQQPLRKTINTPLMFYLGEVVKPFDFLHNFGGTTSVFGIEIAQQSISCGDNCTPQ